jgi:hypothetical protein
LRRKRLTHDSLLRRSDPPIFRRCRIPIRRHVLS